jgi:ribosomal protein S18 acetylase RimI-like enzyme
MNSDEMKSIIWAPKFIKKIAFPRHMQVTKADIKDLESIVTLNKLLHLDFPWFKWDDPKWIREDLENNDYYVIRSNGEIVASMCLKMLDKEEAYIDTMAVQRERQGSGFGRQLIEFAKIHSKQKGRSVLSVDSFCDYGVQEFYEKCGFTRSPILGNYKGQPYYRFSMDL